MNLRTRLRSPRMVHTIYILKLLVLYALAGIVVATGTSDLPAFWHVSQWWDQPIVYQKFVLWMVLLETIGIAGSWGPLAGKVKPMTGGILFWARPGTIRLLPWKWGPGTAGDRRTWFDAAGSTQCIWANSPNPMMLEQASVDRSESAGPARVFRRCPSCGRR